MVKKRTVLSVVIAIVITIALNKHYLFFKPLIVDFDIKGRGVYDIEVQLNKKNNEKFKKIKSAKITVNSNIDNHVNMAVEKTKYPKKTKFIIYSFDNYPIELSNINIRKNKYKLSELNSFEALEGKLEIKGDKLVIYPEKQNASFIYKKKLKVHSPSRFDIRIFLIILILSALLSYKIIDYIVDFKTIKNKSAIEVWFLSIFFIFLLIPMSNINQDIISKKENRYLANWIPLMLPDGNINYNFGNDYNNWFNDRFNFRDEIAPLYNQLRYFLVKDCFISGPIILYKKGGWTFKHIEDFDYFPPEDLERYTNKIAKVLQYCKDRNIKLYIFISPSKELLYRKENYTGIITRDEKAKYLTENVKQKLNFDIIYPLEEFQKAKEKDIIYFKTDHHLTDYGSFVLYNAVMKQIKKDFSDIKIADEKDFNFEYNNLTRFDYDRAFKLGCDYNIANIKDKKLHQIMYKYYNYKKLKNITVTGQYPYFHHYNPQGKYRLMILGDSSQENLAYFLNTSFREIDKYRTNNFNAPNDFPKRNKPFDFQGYIPIIEAKKPDALLLMFLGAHFKNIDDLF